VLGPGHSRQARDALEAQLDGAIRRGLDNPELNPEILDASTEEGFMRLDAIGRIGNFAFGVEIDPANVRALKAPPMGLARWVIPL
jgi:hypothetical protein